MATTVGQHSVATFTSPVNGSTPIDANTVRGNDNTIRSSYNDHDADTGVHVQSSTLASQPAAGTAGRKWITTDTSDYRLWYDDGTRWHEVGNSKIDVLVKADATLAVGDVVKITGYNAGSSAPTVDKVSSASDTAFGVVIEAIATGSTGYITNTGLVFDLVTNSYSVGDTLYANSSGGFTTTKPTSGTYQASAYVLRSHSSQGVLFVEFTEPHIVERSDNTASTIVLRDGSGAFTTGAITSEGLITFASLKGTGSTTVTNILDEDNMASNSATALATQQSIKAYVDSQVGTVDTLAEILANGNTSGGTNLIMSAGDTLTADTIAETTAGSGVTIDSVLLKDDVVNATDIEVGTISANDGVQSAVIANTTGIMTVASSVLTTTDINGGTVDGAVVGGASAAAGTFTTLTANTNLTIAGTTTVDGVIDDDTMATASATKLATSESIKVYVDTQLTAEDLDFAGDSGSGSVDLDSQTFTIAGTSNEVETSGSGQTLTVGLPSNVTIGNNLTVTNDLDVDGTTNLDAVDIDGVTTVGGNILPDANETIDIGATGTRFNDIWASYLYLKRDNNPAVIEGIRNDSSISSSNVLLDIKGEGDLGSGSATGAMIRLVADETWAQGSDSGAHIRFSTTPNNSWDSPTERVRIDNNGRVGIGTTDPDKLLEIAATNTNDGIDVSCYSTTQTSAGTIRLAHSLNGTVGSHTAVTTNDQLGRLFFAGSDGSDFYSGAAIIADATQNYTGTNGGTRLEFWTTPNNTQSRALAMTVDDDGKVGIGTVSPDALLHVEDGTNISMSSSADGQIKIGGSAYNGAIALDGSNMSIYHNSSSRGLVLGTNETARLTITGGGDVGIGTTSPAVRLHVEDSSTEIVRVKGSGTTAAVMIDADGGGSSGHGGYLNVKQNGSTCGIFGVTGAYSGNTNADVGIFAESGRRIEFAVNGSVTPVMVVHSGGNIGMGTISPSEKLDVVGNATISGSLSKGSGSFKIDHPLPEMSDTHHLVHSFVEGPKADLIYRGSVALVDGAATVDLDAAATMTSGTWEVLCRDPQVWVQNEDGWTQVRGSISGSTLSIEAQDADCTDTVSWLVVAERKDPNIVSADWTDEEGRVIVEPLKTVEE